MRPQTMLLLRRDKLAALLGTALLVLAALSAPVLAVEPLITNEGPRTGSPTGVVDPPTLQLTGSLEVAPPEAAMCSPFSVGYSVKNTGTLSPTSGNVSLEVRAAGTGSVALSRQIPWGSRAGTVRIDRLDLAQGAYTLSLRASATNQPSGITREFVLAEQPLTALAPLQARHSTVAFPRVLVLSGHGSSLVDQALVTNILKQSFDQQPLYAKITESYEDFMNQALSGRFNTYVLFEIDEMPSSFAWFLDEAKHGAGVVIIGESDRSRAAAEAFGFKFGKPLPFEGRMLTVAEDAGLYLCGTIPLSSRLLPPQKKGSRAAAFIAGTKHPAILLDRIDKGTVVLLPFSLITTARDLGTSGICSALIRSAVRTAAPETDEESTGEEIIVSSISGPVKARIVKTLPPGSRVIWTSPEAMVKGETITFDLLADTAPQSILYLSEPGKQGAAAPPAEVFFECDGKFVSQGKAE